MITKQTKELIQTIPNNLISKKIKRAMVITLTEAYKQEVKFLSNKWKSKEDAISCGWDEEYKRFKDLNNSINTMEKIKWML